jgi:hypothetical protein
VGAGSQNDANAPRGNFMDLAAEIAGKGLLREIECSPCDRHDASNRFSKPPHH